MSTDASAIPGAHFGQGGGPVAMNAVNCTGMEGRLADCNYVSTAPPACSHSHDASVQCETECKLLTRLIESLHRHRNVGAEKAKALLHSLRVHAQYYTLYITQRDNRY